jgi:nitroreductase
MRMNHPKPIAQPSHPVNDLIRMRWSGRSFSDEQVPDEVILSLMEAVRWSASCYNEQPWSFVLGRKGSEPYEQMLSCLTPSNLEWVKDAPVMLLTVAKTHFALNGLHNRHALHDVGLAIGNFSLQATEAGLNLHQLAGFDHRKAAHLFALPDGHEAVTLIAMGYRGAPDTLPDHLRAKELAPQQRREVKDFLFEGQWGKRYL